MRGLPGLHHARHAPQTLVNGRDRLLDRKKVRVFVAERVLRGFDASSEGGVFGRGKESVTEDRVGAGGYAL
jgi:hypothetical protein